ncbi:hypothetical protein ACQ4M3_32375 [Leptolyngbya sp. AN03gr2]|uniref:hypothetical protein n=1 Tax=unclassified Leptolyngbya TaxID=2650499 RepID=UPI003D31A80F
MENLFNLNQSDSVSMVNPMLPTGDKNANTEVQRSKGSSIAASEMDEALGKAFNEPKLRDSSMNKIEDKVERDSGKSQGKNSLSNFLAQRGQPIQDTDTITPPQLSDAVRKSKSSEEIIKTLFPRDGAIDGDFLDPKGGNNVVLGSDKNDFIIGNGGGTNTIVSGGGAVDHIVLGKDTTNVILDFNPKADMLVLDDNLKLDDIRSVDVGDSTLIVARKSGHILAALASTQGKELSANINFSDASVLDAKALDLSLKAVGDDKFFANVQQGRTQLTGTEKRDKLVGTNKNDVILSS